MANKRRLALFQTGTRVQALFNEVMSRLQILCHTILCQRSFFLTDLQYLCMPYHAGSRPCLVHSCGYIWSSLFVQVFVFSFCFFVNDLQVLYVHTGSLKCISGMNLSPTNYKLLIMLFIVIYLEQNITQ